MRATVRAISIWPRGARHRSEKGAALVELAVTLPLLVLVLVGTIDFARVFYMSIELTNAARAGAQYGANGSGINSENFSGMQAAAAAAAPNLTGVSTQASKWCGCATDNGATFTALAVCSTSPCTGCLVTCPGGQHTVTSVTVTALRTFSTIAPLPGMPSGFQVQRSATLRIAQ